MKTHCQSVLAVIMLSMASACASNSYQGPIEYFDAQEDQWVAGAPDDLQRTSKRRDFNQPFEVSTRKFGEGANSIGQEWFEFHVGDIYYRILRERVDPAFMPTLQRAADEDQGVKMKFVNGRIVTIKTY